VNDPVTQAAIDFARREIPAAGPAAACLRQLVDLAQLLSDRIDALEVPPAAPDLRSELEQVGIQLRAAEEHRDALKRERDEIRRLRDELAAAEQARDEALEGAVLTGEQIQDIGCHYNTARELAKRDNHHETSRSFQQGRARAYHSVLRMVGALESGAHDLIADLDLEQSALIEATDHKVQLEQMREPWTAVVKHKLKQAEDALGRIEHAVHAATGVQVEDTGQGIAKIAEESVAQALRGWVQPVPVMTLEQGSALGAVVAERRRQDEKWGDVRTRDMGSLTKLGFNTPNGLWAKLKGLTYRWPSLDCAEDAIRSSLQEHPEDATVADIFLEELLEAAGAPREGQNLRDELVQCAAVLLFAIESLDYERSKS
jgi:hypothetical protein